MREPTRYKGRDGSPVDPARCAAAVYDASGWYQYQCSRTRNVGEWCAQHDPVRAEARRLRRDAKVKEERARRRRVAARSRAHRFAARLDELFDALQARAGGAVVYLSRDENGDWEVVTGERRFGASIVLHAPSAIALRDYVLGCDEEIRGAVDR